MNKTTIDLAKRLKELRPSIHGISHTYQTNWESGELEETWYIDLPASVKCKDEKELQTKLKAFILSTESDLGFRFPQTTKIMNNGSPNSSTSK